MTEPQAEAPAPSAGALDLLIVEFTELRPTLSVHEILGRPVENDAGEHIGSLDDILAEDDRLAFAVLSVGGFLGIGAHKIVVAFDDLLIGEQEIVLPGATRETLRQLTAYDHQRARQERAPRKPARHRSGDIVESGGAELPGTITDISDGR
jgi:hypothetical protein